MSSGPGLSIPSPWLKRLPWTGTENVGVLGE